MDELVTPRGRYPHLRVAGDLIFVSGTSARQPDNTITGATVDDLGTATLDMTTQARAVFDNVNRVLGTVGASLDDVVDVTGFLVNMNDFGAYNAVWAEYFDESGPARTTVAVHQLPHPLLLLEVKATARRESSP
jgi:2-aminomuconate deaminase